MTLSTPCKLPENSEKIICVRASRASELGKLSHFHIQKLIFKVSVICWYNVSHFDILLYYEGPSGGRCGRGVSLPLQGDFENLCVKTSFSCTLIAIIRG